MADGEKKATENNSTERPEDRKYEIRVKRHGKEWPVAISSSRTG